MFVGFRLLRFLFLRFIPRLYMLVINLFFCFASPMLCLSCSTRLHAHFTHSTLKTAFQQLCMCHNGKGQQGAA